MSEEYQDIINSLLKSEDSIIKYNSCGGLLYYDKKTCTITGADKTVEKLDICEIMGDEAENVYHIGKMAFIGCKNLKSAVLPYGVKKVSESLFCWCKALEYVNLPDSITEIESNAFAGCGNLKKIEIPMYTEIIRERAFNVCFEMKSLVFRGKIREIGEEAFRSCANLKEIIIPEGAVIIGNRAFTGCYGAENLILPNTLEYIGEMAFESCTRLKKAIIPASVRKIGTNAFMNCTALKTIVFEKETEISELFEKNSDSVVISNVSVYNWDIDKRYFIFVNFLKSLKYDTEYNKDVLLENGRYCREVAENFYDDIINDEHIRSFVTENKGILPQDAEKIIEKTNNFDVRAEILEYINKNFTDDEIESALESSYWL